MSTIRAALCQGAEQPFHIVDVELDDELRSDEIRVRIVASGICHTDLAVRDGQVPTPLPAVLGHEGAGIVEAVGREVSYVAPGDRVIMSFNSCGACPSCHAELPPYCYDFFPHNFSGRRPDGTATVTHDGEAVSANFFGQSSFATHAIAHERNVVKIPASADDLPLETLAPIGCGLMTGSGAVLRSMKVQPGLPLVVIGAGTVGMAAVMAGAIVGASPIIAVDLVDSRLELAKELGATHAFNGRDAAFDKIRELCPQGVGYVFDTTGSNKLIQQAFDLLSPKGTLGMVGASPPEAELTFNESAFMGGGRTVMGILGGDSDGGDFLLELIAYHQEGRFPFDKLIRVFDFEDINEAVEASENGSVVKPVLRIRAEA